MDVDLEQGTVRGTTWANVYSPQAARLDMDLLPQPAMATDRRTGSVVVVERPARDGTGRHEHDSRVWTC